MGESLLLASYSRRGGEKSYHVFYFRRRGGEKSFHGFLVIFKNNLTGKCMWHLL